MNIKFVNNKIDMREYKVGNVIIGTSGGQYLICEKDSKLGLLDLKTYKFVEDCKFEKKK